MGIVQASLRTCHGVTDYEETDLNSRALLRCYSALSTSISILNICMLVFGILALTNVFNPEAARLIVGISLVVTGGLEALFYFMRLVNSRDYCMKTFFIMVNVYIVIIGVLTLNGGHTTSSAAWSAIMFGAVGALHISTFIHYLTLYQRSREAWLNDHAPTANAAEQDPVVSQQRELDYWNARSAQAQQNTQASGAQQQQAQPQQQQAQQAQSHQRPKDHRFPGQGHRLGGD